MRKDICRRERVGTRDANEGIRLPAATKPMLEPKTKALQSRSHSLLASLEWLLKRMEVVRSEARVINNRRTGKSILKLRSVS